MSGTIQDWENGRARQEIESYFDLLSELPEADEPPTTEALAKPEPCVLMERTFAGWSTSLEWHPATGLTCTVRQGHESKPYVFAVPEGVSPLEVFEHPYVYAGDIPA